MNVKAFKYLSPLLIYVLAWLAFTQHGWLCWSPMLYAWVLLPAVELLIRPDERNMSAAEEELAKNDRIYDYLLYGIVVLQFIALYKFLTVITLPGFQSWEVAGKVFTMGLLCGTFGINVGHELGHRVNAFEQALAKALLMTSLYMHFFIEHNKGHHKNVATRHDPSSARLNEPLYTFYFRTIIFTYLSAWKISNDEMKKKGLPAWSLKNEMLQVQIIQLVFIAFLFFVFGGTAVLYFLGAAAMGIALLETVNYIEHYGLQRKETAPGKYERAMPWHSWNSDHHYLASKKYQLLKHHDDAPQLPTGYPGSMILALVPPVWFYIMNRKIKRLNKS